MEASEVRSIVKEELAKGFPDGDVDAHRRYHDGVNKALEKKTKLIDNVKEKTFTAVIWALLLLCGNALLEYAKKHFNT